MQAILDKNYTSSGEVRAWAFGLGMENLYLQVGFCLRHFHIDDIMSTS